ncbi:MAG: AGE family epimerase/isomerase [Granulosicoccus sp.]|nr:AGE family epimerase/isomerase [Granulosicoccus sp.]
MNIPTLPQFSSANFLRQHIQSILEFYEPRVRAADGGFHQCFLDDGTVYNSELRHLVSSARFVFNYASAYRFHGAEHHREWAASGFEYLKRLHRQPQGHYAWVIEDGNVTDGRAMAYGHAFVMLAASSCVQAGITDAAGTIADVWDLMEELFWDADGKAYADERDSTLQVLDSYRGQNANMHSCEALLAAFQATEDVRYLERAEMLAERFAVELAGLNDGLIWEHYDRHWQCDMQYNIDKPDDLFKPWGFQPGHQLEWCKLLLALNQERANPTWVQRATELYDVAMTRGWDPEFGGLVYGFAPDGTFSDAYKYFWVHAEAFAAAWRLYRQHGDERYLQDYNRLWEYSWRHLIDHEHGAWFRIRTREGAPVDKLKSPPGKTDYHTMGACWDVLSQPV